MDTWGAASFDNDSASEWFFRVEESHDPGALIADTLDLAVSAPEHLDVEICSQAVAAAELCASCAGELPPRLPDRIERWVASHPHHSTPEEVAHAARAIARVRTESELRELWAQSAEADGENEWLPQIQELLDRLQRSGTQTGD